MRLLSRRVRKAPGEVPGTAIASETSKSTASACQLWTGDADCKRIRLTLTGLQLFEP